MVTEHFSEGNRRLSNTNPLKSEATISGFQENKNIKMII